MIIKVGALKYRVEIVPDKEMPDNCSGETDSNKNLIRIGESVEKQSFTHRLLHEVLHAINVEWEEHEVELLAVILEQVLVDNPEFTRLFLKR